MNLASLLRQMRAVVGELPAKLHADVLRAHKQDGRVVTALLHMVARERDDACANAVRLVAEICGKGALEPLLDRCMRLDGLEDQPVRDAMGDVLPPFGREALDGLLQRVAGATKAGRRVMLEVLASLGVRDERIFVSLCELVETDAILGSTLLQVYGDPRGAPMVREVIGHHRPDFSLRSGHSVVFWLLDDYEGLGGVLDESLVGTLHDIADMIHAHAEGTEPAGVRLDDPNALEKLAERATTSMEELLIAEFALRERTIVGKSDAFLEFAKSAGMYSAFPDRVAAAHGLKIAELMWEAAGTRDTQKRAALIAEAVSMVAPDEREFFERVQVPSLLARRRDGRVALRTV